MERRIFLKYGTSAAIAAALTACGGGGGSSPYVAPPEPARSKVVVGWNNVVLNAVRATRAVPPVAARALAIVHTAMYNAWSAYDPVAVSTIAPGSMLRRPAAEQTPDNAMKAVSFAAYATLVDLFPTQQAAFDAQMALLGYKPAEATPDFTLPQGVGSISARLLLDAAHADGANQLGNLTAGGLPYADYSNYSARNAPLVIGEPTLRSAIADPGTWQPLAFRDSAGVLRTQSFVTPFWGQVRPFALINGAQFRPSAPPAFGSSAYEDRARGMVATQVALTEVQKAMVVYWAGGATGELPSTYWSQFAQFISQRDSHSEADDVKLFFALSNAVFDAGIAAWDAKLAYNSERPITAVRHVMAGERIQGYGAGPAAGLQAIAGESWLPYQQLTNPTPAHPDHVSGHSTYSAASAAVLRMFTGSDVFNHHVDIPARSMLYDPTLPAADMTLGWDTFTYAACEAGISRVYGGIHFHDADLAGRALGEQVGAAVFVKACNHWLGRV